MGGHTVATATAVIDKMLAGNPTASQLKAKVEALDDLICQIEWACGWPALVASLKSDLARVGSALRKHPRHEPRCTGHALMLQRRRERIEQRKQEIQP